MQLCVVITSLLLFWCCKQNLTKDDIFKANALGWCIEWVSSSTRVAPTSLAAVHIKQSHLNAGRGLQQKQKHR